MMPARKLLHCAVYTRKSSEEGLEQDFNSLEAQREACEAYIRSQAHEGWRLLPERFDDGGFSGGSLERPALKLLLERIRDKRIDVIVIYKIDRLTRSLMDFAKLAELFEKEGVSFVSVTQQFNTTTSMGRLMLNVLLSFAQFEREITGERIRDKIAASKKKGIWMGGSVPAGYDVRNRALVINEEDAKTVRTLFRLYSEFSSVRKVWAEAKRLGLRTPVRTTQKGRAIGGKQFFPGNIYQLLSSPIYIGKLPHKGQVYDGNHPPVIDIAQWEAVQSGIAGNRVDRRYGRNTKSPSPLTGLLYDANGVRFTPTQTTKKSGQRYRYYVHPALTTGVAPPNSNLPRIPALEIEHAVRKGIAELLGYPTKLLAALNHHLQGPAPEHALKQAQELAADILNATPTTWMPMIRPALNRVILSEDCIVLSIAPDNLSRILIADNIQQASQYLNRLNDDDASVVEYRIPVRVQLRRSGAMKLVVGNCQSTAAEPDPAIEKTLANAFAWAEMMKDGRADSVRYIATLEKVTEAWITRTLRMAYLAPVVVEAVLRGQTGSELTAQTLSKLAGASPLWSQQTHRIWAEVGRCSGRHFLHTGGGTGSIPVAPRH